MTSASPDPLWIRTALSKALFQTKRKYCLASWSQLLMLGTRPRDGSALTLPLGGIDLPKSSCSRRSMMKELTFGVLGASYPRSQQAVWLIFNKDSIERDEDCLEEKCANRSLLLRQRMPRVQCLMKKTSSTRSLSSLEESAKKMSASFPIRIN